MSSLGYQHALDGKGVGTGLPLRRASKLYHVEPNIVYPNAFSTSTTTTDMHAYHKGIFLRTPHLPITRVIEPYINNHKAPGGDGTFTRRQFFVIKRGQPVMASSKREGQVGLIAADGKVETRQYLDPAKMARADVRLDGYSVDGGDTMIDVETFEGLEEDTQYAADGTEDAEAPYQKQNFREVYSGFEDENDEIATGGQDMRAEIDKALNGQTDIVKYVEVDADSMYFGSATNADGWIAPSTGGFPRTVFFNEMDQEAGVTLPSDGSDSPRIVSPIGNTVNVTADNAGNYKDSAIVLPAQKTIGFAHTDLEQATNMRFHHFQTGLDVHSPMRKGQHMIPFVDVVKLKALVADRAPDVEFDFTDISEGKSGLKVGVALEGDASEAKQLSVQNRYSQLQAADAGYANLHYNFGAPFLTTTKFPEHHDEVVPDLFANFVLRGSGYFQEDATVADTESAFGQNSDGTSSYGLSQSELDANTNGEVTAADAHRCGQVINVFDMPEQSMLKYVMNNEPSLRKTTDWANDMYERVRSADTAGLEPILADFGLMILGGSSYDWSSNYIPEWDDRRQTLAAIGIVELHANTLTNR